MQKKGGLGTSDKKSKKRVIVFAMLIILILISIPIIIFIVSGKIGLSLFESVSNQITGNDAPEPIYSHMTGLKISSTKENSDPTFCVQIPNGSTDGARPQAGLGQAGVVFEAIAETGITRFAAIFQNPAVSLIGPIRSLRPYYLEWDTPFDCTVVHDGGSQEALAAVSSGKYRNLDEDFRYMWKVDYIDGQYRYWNNVFTSPTKLTEFNQAHSYTTSQPKTFPRLTPAEVDSLLAAPTSCADDDEFDTPTENANDNSATHLSVSFTGLQDYLVHYNYDPATNSYLRSYAHGGAHMSYFCSSSLGNPPEGCELQQIAPKAVVAMHVQEHTMSDNYHESIKTVGSGKAEIFQNGQLISGTWKKSSIDSQIEFYDENETAIRFTPGQLWITAVPQFGSVVWE